MEIIDLKEKVIKSAEGEKKLQQPMQEVAAPAPSAPFASASASAPAPTTPDLWSYRTLFLAQQPGTKADKFKEVRRHATSNAKVTNSLSMLDLPIQQARLIHDIETDPGPGTGREEQ